MNSHRTGSRAMALLRTVSSTSNQYGRRYCRRGTSFRSLKTRPGRIRMASAGEEEGGISSTAKEYLRKSTEALRPWAAPAGVIGFLAFLLGPIWSGIDRIPPLRTFEQIVGLYAIAYFVPANLITCVTFFAYCIISRYPPSCDALEVLTLRSLILFPLLVAPTSRARRRQRLRIFASTWASRLAGRPYSFAFEEDERAEELKSQVENDHNLPTLRSFLFNLFFTLLVFRLA